MTAPDRRTQAFRDAMAFEIELDDPTVITPPRQLEALSARTASEDSTPLPLVDRVDGPPFPLSSETIAFADRVRFVLTFYCRIKPEQAQQVVRRARNLMPRGR